MPLHHIRARHATYDQLDLRAVFERLVLAGWHRIWPPTGQPLKPLYLCLLRDPHDWTYLALAGRAEAHYNLGEKDLAFVDAKESFEMHPNELALWLLGDLAKDKHHDADAKHFWMGAYHLGSRDDRLLERLRSVGVQDPAIEPNGEPERYVQGGRFGRPRTIQHARSRPCKDPLSRRSRRATRIL